MDVEAVFNGFAGNEAGNFVFFAVFLVKTFNRFLGKVTESKTLQNQMFKTGFKTTLKKFEKAVEAGDKAVAEGCYKDAVSKIDKAVAKGALHVNAGARKKSQFTVKLNAMK